MPLPMELKIPNQRRFSEKFNFRKVPAYIRNVSAQSAIWFNKSRWHAKPSVHSGCGVGETRG